ncbi:MAG: hypothetical protein WKF30_14685 [Pyrinomonadaceae bacterium]
MELSVPTSSDFNYKRTVISHGWCELPPFSFDKETWTLARVLEPDDARPVAVRISEGPASLIVRTPHKLGRRAVAAVVRDVRHIFRLDDALAEFYAATSAHAEFAWIAREGAGRLLRSPTVFEGLVKTICTTNCSWAFTDKMVVNLVAGLGRETRDAQRAFPSAAAMAAAPLHFTQMSRAGYRAPYLKELAERVASGALDTEAWLRSALPTDELKREIKSVKGVGDYAAENLLKLMGRYDGLALDSWVRAKYTRTRNGGRPTTDQKISRTYACFRSWRGLALWCDMTRDWLDEGQAVKW